MATTFRHARKTLRRQGTRSFQRGGLCGVGFAPLSAHRRIFHLPKFTTHLCSPTPYSRARLYVRAITALIIVALPLPCSAQVQKSSPFPSSPAPDLVTVSGKIYKHARVQRVEPDGITYMYDGGMSKFEFTELPESVQKQYHYDPVKAAAFAKADADEQRQIFESAQAEQAQRTAKRKAELDIQVNGPPPELHTLEEVETDQPAFVDRRIKFKGSLKVDSYYNFGYSDAQFSYFAFRFTDEKGRRAALYEIRTPGQRLRDFLLKNGETKGTVTIRIDPVRFDSNASSVFADILDFTPEQAAPKSNVP
ncbi:MAG: hypothetical protein INR69_19070 [Mucilaginibacter polytrichastri]|nr:hypothetical protein [Mucilaginibacter polytrichastri]